MSSIAKPILFGNDFQSAWARLTKDIPLSRIHTRKQYDLVVRAMEYLADLVNDDPGHSLAGLLEIFEVIVEDYDRIHHQIPSVSGVELLRSLMTEHGHKDQIGTRTDNPQNRNHPGTSGKSETGSNSFGATPVTQNRNHRQ